MNSFIESVAWFGWWKLLVQLSCDVEESNSQFCRASIELLDTLLCASRWLKSNFKIEFSLIGDATKNTLQWVAHLYSMTLFLVVSETRTYCTFIFAFLYVWSTTPNDSQATTYEMSIRRITDSHMFRVTDTNK